MIIGSVLPYEYCGQCNAKRSYATCSKFVKWKMRQLFSAEILKIFLLAPSVYDFNIFYCCFRTYQTTQVGPFERPP